MCWTAIARSAGMRAVLAPTAKAGTGARGVTWAAAASAACIRVRARPVRRWSMRIPMPASLRPRGAGGVFAGATRVTGPPGVGRGWSLAGVVLAGGGFRLAGLVWCCAGGPGGVGACRRLGWEAVRVPCGRHEEGWGGLGTAGMGCGGCSPLRREFVRVGTKGLAGGSGGSSALLARAALYRRLRRSGCSRRRVAGSSCRAGQRTGERGNVSRHVVREGGAGGDLPPPRHPGRHTAERRASPATPSGRHTDGRRPAPSTPPRPAHGRERTSRPTPADTRAEDDQPHPPPRPTPAGSPPPPTAGTPRTPPAQPPEASARPTPSPGPRPPRRPVVPGGGPRRPSRGGPVPPWPLVPRGRFPGRFRRGPGGACGT